MADDAVDLTGEEAADGGYSRASSSCAPSGFLSGLAECDSCSEDEQPVEEFLQDEHELADTTARQHEEDGRDLQGIPWGRLQVPRERYRQQRLQQYRNYMNCIPDEDWDAVRAELVAPWPQPRPLPRQRASYRFVRNWRGVPSSIVHFQLRNLLWAASAHDVFVVYDNRVQHWNSATRRCEDVLDLRGAPKGPRLPSMGRVQVSTLAVSCGLLAAGGFTGELVLGRLARHEPEACWGDEDSEYEEDTEEEPAEQRCWQERGQQQQHHPQQQQQQQQQQQRHEEHEALMGAAGPAACEVLHSCRVTQSENGITNGIEIFDSCSFGCCVMTSNNDCCVRLFDVTGMRPQQRLAFPFAVNYATARPDGAGLGGGPLLAVVGDDPLTWLMDSRSGLEVMKLEGHRDFSFAVEWHPAGQLLATGNQDSTMRVWDVRQPSSPLAVLGGSLGAIRSLRFSSDGSCLAAAEPADFVHVYDVASGFSRVQEIDLFGEVAGISFSPDASALFVAISDSMYSSLLQYQRAPPVCG
ncbi:hypothetical protein OEZ85_008262 [Tetradesmus obliquus]|uniref:DUF2415 domain-containing protein n=1 Tax=Tetradesmus obliquus TaxID=3088 RepID=A0ABY8TKL1_TETOB|nr:hypothetical protein OEZ85_008262 [Tetradesmus obliquus]